MRKVKFVLVFVVLSLLLFGIGAAPEASAQGPTKDHERGITRITQEERNGEAVTVIETGLAVRPLDKSDSALSGGGTVNLAARIIIGGGGLNFAAKMKGEAEVSVNGGVAKAWQVLSLDGIQKKDTSGSPCWAPNGGNCVNRANGDHNGWFIVSNHEMVGLNVAFTEIWWNNGTNQGANVNVTHTF